MALLPKTEWKANSVAPRAAGPSVTAMGAAFKWAADDAVPEGIRTGFHRAAEMAEEYMQANARWQDQTGRARKGLHAFVEEPGRDQFGLVLSHGQDVDYGVYLENRWNGRFAIVVPTTQVFASRLDKIVAGEIELALEGRGSQFRHRESGQWA